MIVMLRQDAFTVVSVFMPAARFSPAAEEPASLATSQVVVFSIMASAVADSSLQDFIDLTLVVEFLLSLDAIDGDDFFESKFCKTLAYDVTELTDVAEVEAATLAAAPPGEISSLADIILSYTLQ
ncbi:hypothetical protein GQX74_013079 [Glossina fuscipes]|nr:hypothetical protein GQX74_013079 [Glossina fuscipes]